MRVVKKLMILGELLKFFLLNQLIKHEEFLLVEFNMNCIEYFTTLLYYFKFEVRNPKNFICTGDDLKVLYIFMKKLVCLVKVL